ncbi:MAG TPA: hypothetical protein VE993_17200 [Stellaceae bacterium]|nr:hypothetical protein [Stellaceae bacterium]
MKVWVSTAVVLLVVVPTAAGAGPCRPGKLHHHRRCFAVPAILDLTTVPDISQRIVGHEPAAPSPRPQGAAAPSADGYTGPTVGVSKLGRAPTVGYHWSLN